LKGLLILKSALLCHAGGDRFVLCSLATELKSQFSDAVQSNNLSIQQDTS